MQRQVDLIRAVEVPKSLDADIAASPQMAGLPDCRQRPHRGFTVPTAAVQRAGFFFPTNGSFPLRSC